MSAGLTFRPLVACTHRSENALGGCRLDQTLNGPGGLVTPRATKTHVDDLAACLHCFEVGLKLLQGHAVSVFASRRSATREQPQECKVRTTSSVTEPVQPNIYYS